MSGNHHMTYVFEHAPPADGYELSDALEDTLRAIDGIDLVELVNDDYREDDHTRVLTFRLHYSRDGLEHGLLGVDFFDGKLGGRWRCVGEYDS